MSLSNISADKAFEIRFDGRGFSDILYLGGNDMETASFISSKVFKTVENVLCLPNEKAYLITRGKKGELVDKVIPDFSADAQCGS